MSVAEDQSVLSRIVGERLTGVCFVMDYLQLQFEDNTLTVLTPHDISVDGRRVQLGDLGYRDTLCDRITKVATGLTLREEELRISFDDGTAFTATLEVEGYAGNEAINFHFRENREMQILVIHAV